MPTIGEIIGSTAPAESARKSFRTIGDVLNDVPSDVGQFTPQPKRRKPPTLGAATGDITPIEEQRFFGPPDTVATNFGFRVERKEIFPDRGGVRIPKTNTIQDFIAGIAGNITGLDATPKRPTFDELNPPREPGDPVRRIGKQLAIDAGELNPDGTAKQSGVAIGAFVGEVGSFVGATKILRLKSVQRVVGPMLKAIGPQAARAVQVGVAGALIEAKNQSVDVATGGEFDPFAVLRRGLEFSLFEAAFARKASGITRIARQNIKSKIRELRGVKTSVEPKPSGGVKAVPPEVDLAEATLDVRSSKTVRPNTAPPKYETPFNRTSVESMADDAIVNDVNVKVPGKNIQQTELLGGAKAKTEFVPAKVPSVTKSDLDVVKNMNELPDGFASKTLKKFGFNLARVPIGSNVMDLSIRTAFRQFRSLGDGPKRIFYDKVVDISGAIDKTNRAFFRASKRVEKGARVGNKKYNERIAIFAINKQSGGKALLDKMGITDIPTLTAEELRAYSWGQVKFAKAFEQINAARKASGLSEINKVNDYFTFARTAETLEKHGFTQMNASPQQFSDNLAQARTTPFASAKSRAGMPVAPVELDYFGVMNRYVEQATYHAKMGPQVAQMNQYLNGSFADGFSLASHNPEAYQFLSGWVNRVGRVRLSVLPERVENILRATSSNIAGATLAFSLRSFLIQPSALRNTVGTLGWEYTTRGLGALNPSTRRFIMRNSNLIGRTSDVSITHGARTTGTTSGQGVIRSGLRKSLNLQKRATKTGFKGLEGLDLVTAQVTWHGAYLQAKEILKLKGREAFRYANDVVVNTQASAKAHDVSAIQGSSLGKSVTTFQTFAINDFGFLMEDVLGSRLNLTVTQKANNMIKYIVATSIVNTLYEQAGMNSPFPSPITEFNKRRGEGKSTGAALTGASLELLEQVPIIGGAARFGSTPLGATFQFAADVVELPFSASLGRNVNKRVLELTLKGLGVPGSSQVFKTIRNEKRKEKEANKKPTRPRRGRNR